nr:uncharacterized protein LOC123752176 isoform X1 [Procambarus clarkii]
MMMYSTSRLYHITRRLSNIIACKDSSRWFTSVNDIKSSCHIRKSAITRQSACAAFYSSHPVCSLAVCSSQEILQQQSALPRTTVNYYQHRYYRSGRDGQSVERQGDKQQPQKRSPELMDFPWIIWPSLWHIFRNFIFANLIIHRYLDQEFSLSSFKAGAIQALVYVSQELSKGNFEALNELITKPTIEEMKKNFARFSMKQRLDLAIVAEDIFFSFPYQIGIIFTNEGTSHERIFVEITMCYHVFRDFQDHINSSASLESPDLSVSLPGELKTSGPSLLLITSNLERLYSSGEAVCLACCFTVQLNQQFNIGYVV